MWLFFTLPPIPNFSYSSTNHNHYLPSWCHFMHLQGKPPHSLDWPLYLQSALLSSHNYIPLTSVTRPVTNTTFPIQILATCSSSNLIYLLTCTQCNAFYIGETRNSLSTWMNIHQFSAKNTDTPSSSSSYQISLITFNSCWNVYVLRTYHLTTFKLLVTILN